MKLLAAILVATAAMAADQSALRPAGPQSAHIHWLWDVMLWTSVAVYVIVMVVLFAGVWHRRKATDPTTMTDSKLEQYIVAGVALTTVILFGLLVSSVAVGKATSDLDPRNGLTINVTGYQWWWRVEYVHPDPQQYITTANEIHVPIGRPVTAVLNGADVIHSFWAPNLHGKRDLIPGQKTSIVFRVDKPGVYRGQCAEFCGLQHAHMAFLVVAEPQEQFDAWYANQVKPSVEPQTDEQIRGREVFLSHACVMCHTIRGTKAGARLGPDLTHLKSRATIAAATIPNERGQLGGWVINAQSIKQGVRMPPNPLAPDELSALLGYLESLK
jgi:cytochrome c oxidase subunit II